MACIKVLHIILYRVWGLEWNFRVGIPAIHKLPCRHVNYARCDEDLMNKKGVMCVNSPRMLLAKGA